MKASPWPLPIRLIHWSQVVLLSCDLLFLETGEWAHEYVGYTLAGLVAIRLALIVFSPNGQYKIHLPSPAAIKQQVANKQWVYQHHSPLGSLMIIGIWSLMLAAAGSGFLQTTDAFWGEDWVQLLHTVVVYSLFSLIVVHVSAIVVLQRVIKLPLLQRMLRG